uniref:RNA-directed DNA polymerase n=1 Tax=Strongyloides papillosus TaxID=174720 RepID=A0A0N5CBS7_STREA
MKRSLRLKEKLSGISSFTGKTLEENIRIAENIGKAIAITEVAESSKMSEIDPPAILEDNGIQPINEGNLSGNVRTDNGQRNMTEADIQALAGTLAQMFNQGIIRIPGALPHINGDGTDVNDHVNDEGRRIMQQDDYGIRGQRQADNRGYTAGIHGHYTAGNGDLCEDHGIGNEGHGAEVQHVGMDLRDSRYVQPRESIKKPDNFKKDMVFDAWKFRFENYCDIIGIKGDARLKNLIMYLDDKVYLEIRNMKNLLTDYEDLCDYLTDHYSGILTEDAASYELELLLSRRITRLPDLEETSKRIEELIEAKYPKDSRDRKLREKVEAVTRILPAECRSKFGCGIKYTSFDEAMANAKRIWTYESQAKRLHDKGISINGNENHNRNTNRSYDKNTSTINSKLKCFICQGIGHKKYQCPKRNKTHTNSIEIDSVECSNIVSMGSPDMKNVLELKDRFDLTGVVIQVNGYNTVALIDTGSNEVVLNPSLARNLHLKLTGHHTSIKSFQRSHRARKCLNPVEIKMLDECYILENIFVPEHDLSNSLYEVVIGNSILRRLNSTMNLTTGEISKLDDDEPIFENNIECNLIMGDIDQGVDREKFIESIKRDFSGCIQKSPSDLGPGKLMSGPIETYDTEPYPFPIYTVPYNDKPIANELLKKLIDADVLEETDSQRLHPIMVVKKATPGQYRLIADMRGTNSITRKFRYNIPNQRELFQQIGSFDYCSKLDLVDSFYQISIPEASRKNMAIRTDLGEFQFKRLVQGATNSAAEMQRALTNLFRNLSEHVHVFVDDILITTSGSLEKHEEVLRAVFMKCHEYELKVNLQKSVMFAKSCTFLGHTISKHGIVPSEENLKTFARRPLPVNKKQLLGALQSANFYRQFIKDFSIITNDLYDLTTKRSKNICLEGKLKSDYEKLCKAMSDPEMLYHADKSGVYILTTDASESCIGACLSQIQEGKERPISYFSKKLKATIKGRCPTYLELLAIVKALRYYKFILTGSKIYVKTDHRPLLCLNKSTIDKKYLELIAEIESYNVELEYLNGKSNHVADDLSRNSGQAVESPPGTTEVSECSVIVNETGVRRQRGRPRKNKEIAKGANSTQDWKEVTPMPSTLPMNDEMIATSPISDLLSTTTPTTELMPEIPNTTDLMNVASLPSADLIENSSTTSELMNKNDKIVSTIVPTMIKRKRGRPIKESKAVQSAEMLNLPSLKNKEDSRFGVSNLKKLGREDEKEIFRLSHDEQGHFGFSKMKNLVESRNINIDDLDNKLRLYLKQCQVCQKRNIAVRMIPESKNVVYESPGQNMSIDIMGPISPTAFDGSKHVLCAIDSFSRYCYIIPLKSCTTEEVTQALYNQVFCYHGIPKSIKTDGAKYFTSHNFEQFLKSLNIEHQVSSPHHSRGNCLVERSFRWISATIAKISREKPNLWPQMLQQVAFYYNTTRNETTGSTPYFLTHLREANLLMDQFLGSYSSGIFDENRTLYDLIEAAAIIRQQSKEFSDATRQVLNRKVKYRRIPEYKAGDKILVKMPDSEKDIGSKFKLLYQ